MNFKKIYKKIISKFYILLYRSQRKLIISNKVNLNHRTILGDYIRINQNVNIYDSTVGSGTYIGWDCNLSNCLIGKFCSIAPEVQIIYGTHPLRNFVSTHPAFFSTQKQAGFTFVKENIFNEFNYIPETNNKSVSIGNDVWIGYGAMILEGIEIGDGAVVGAGAVVTKNVPPYSIVGGVPAKIIRYRYDENIVDFLLKFKWWNKNFDWLEKNAEYFSNIDLFYKKFNDNEVSK